MNDVPGLDIREMVITFLAESLARSGRSMSSQPLLASR